MSYASARINSSGVRNSGLKQTPAGISTVSKGILKNQSKVSSLAATHGILRKDPEAALNEGLGLNPNLNVEDEYIENLLKQIQFMTLEIKLMKEKLEENKTRVGGGMLGKDARPLIDHAIESQGKYRNMKDDLERTINGTDLNIKKLEGENLSLESKKDYLIRVMENLRKKQEGMVQSYEDQLNDLKRKYQSESKKKEELESEIFRIKKNLEKVQEEHAKLFQQQEIKAMHEDLEEKLIKEEERIEHEDDEVKRIELENLEKEMEEEKIKLERNPRFQELSKENAQLKAQYVKIEKEVSDIQYQAVELEHLVDLAMKRKEKEAEERRRLMDELERQKLVLEEIEKRNKLKIEKKLRESESPEIKKLQRELQRLDKELEDLKNSYEKSEQNYKKIMIERIQKTFYLIQLQKENKKSEENLGAISVENNKLQQPVHKLNVAIAEKSEKLQIRLEEKEELEKHFKDVEKDFVKLKTLSDYFAKKVNLDEDLKNFNIEELLRIKNSNNQVNDNIEDLVEKWDKIKKFSKGTK